jgi:hypothetical protein
VADTRFTVEMEDKVSGPASKASSSLAGLNKAASAVQGVLGTMWNSFLGPAIEAHDEMAMMRAQMHALGGSAKSGDAVIAMLGKIGDKAGFIDDELAPVAQKLMAIGVPAREFKATMEAVASQKALGLGGEDAIVNVLTKLQGHLKVTTKDLARLAKTAGVTGPEMAAKMGMPLDKFQASLKAGTLDTVKLKAAIVELGKERGAEAAKAKAQSFNYQVKKLKDDFADSFEKMDTKPLIAGLKALAPAAAQAAVAAAKLGTWVIRLGSALAKPLKMVLDFGPIKWVTDQLATIPDLLEDIFEGEQRLANMGKEQEAHAANTARVDSAVKYHNAQMKMFAEQKKAGMAQSIIDKELAAERGMTTAMLTGTGKEGADQAKAMGPKMAAALEASEAANAKGKEAGTAYADGLASTAGKAKAAGAAVGDAGKAGLDSSNKRASPPKEYVMRGHEAAQAFAGGFEGHASRVGSAFSRGGRVASSSIANSNRSGGSAKGGGGATIHFAAGAIVIHGASGAEELSEQILARTLERVALARGLG